MKEFLKKLLRNFGIRITRWRPANRFQAMDDTLIIMRGMGYSPKVIVDGGANVGHWTLVARTIFPEAEFHLIEPLPGCEEDLRQLGGGSGRLYIHPVAVTEPGIECVRMVSNGMNDKGTGSHVVSVNDKRNTIEVKATTLDSLFANRIVPEDRALVKLDLEGHEMTALRGAERLLENIEVILTEVQFFQINNNGFPTFVDLLRFLNEREFIFFDVACLSQRPRDMRLKMGDVVFVRHGSPLLSDSSWI